MSKMRRLVVAAMALAAAVTFTPVKASAFKVNDNNDVYGYTTMWGILDESAFNTAKDSSGEKGKDKSFGFQLKQARLGAKGNMADGVLGYAVLFDGAGSSGSGTGTTSNVAFVEGWATVRPLGKNFDINIGQFRPYGSYEVGVVSGADIVNLDVFAAGSKQMAGFLAGSNNTRDRGIEFVVKNIAEIATLKISATNGYGNNGDVGGSLSGSKAIWSNGMLDAAYTAALIVKPFEGFRLNAGYGMNKHDNAVVNLNSYSGTVGSDGTAVTVTNSNSKTVVDLDRKMYSAGFELDLHDAGLWIDGEYASLKADDKDTLKPGYEVKGWYLRAGYFLLPKTLELVACYEAAEETAKTGAEKDKETQYMLAARYHLDKLVFTLEYEKRDYDNSNDDPTRLAFRTVLKY
ncbi:MAG: hypothetical protein HZB29_09685 [Nitrospinae bacterium]|nr:hypothetical protein [Nitrospinota bacterium]